MKKLGIEEKAKAYDEVIEKLRDFYRDYDTVSGLIDVKEELANLIPELAESKDERVRKAIINVFATHKDYEVFFGASVKDILAWLEKQGEQKGTLCDTCRKAQPSHSYQDITALGRCAVEHEQKPTEWSKEDKVMLDEIIDFFENGTVKLQHDLSLYASWLKSIKDRVQPQPKQEWSEEDEKMKDAIYSCVDLHYDGLAKTSLLIWLKSLRPQNWTKEDKEIYISCLQRLGTGNPEQPETINSKWFKEHVYSQKKKKWKPSKEQIEALEHFVRSIGESGYASSYDNTTKLLYSLLAGLKKLMEE